MRFQISYQGGTTHEVELPGSVCVVGRDPGCDIVLNDSKCSRRHAVIEDGPTGLSIRDAGSANGIFVNGRRVEKAPLEPGDRVKLGEVQLRLLPEIGETVVVAPEGLELETAERGPSELGDSQPGKAPSAPQLPTAPPASAPLRKPAPRAPAAPVSRPVRRVPQALGRPATVSLLAGLWALFVPLAVAGALVGAARLQAGWVGWLGAGLLAAVAAGLGTSMALGLRALAPWARHLQIASAAVSLLACPFTLAAATVLLYMARPEVKAAFEGTTPALGTPLDSAEPTFALSLVGLLLVGLALTAIAVLVL
jgi:Inner membrane component of T3SS, cytoplasmic domain